MNSYEFTYEVRLDDLDYMNIVGNANWLIFLERTRIDLLKAIGFPFSELQKLNIGGVVAESHIKYIRPAKFEDQLTFTITPNDLFEHGFHLTYKAINQLKVVCLTANFKIVIVNQSGRPTPVPEKLRLCLLDSPK